MSVDAQIGVNFRCKHMSTCTMLDVRISLPFFFFFFFLGGGGCFLFVCLVGWFLDVCFFFVFFFFFFGGGGIFAGLFHACVVKFSFSSLVLSFEYEHFF